LGSILTGSESFSELLDLASRGNQRHVDTYTDQLFAAEKVSKRDDSLYSGLGATRKPGLIYCFGQCVGAKLGDFKREDLAMSLLHNNILEIVYIISLTAALAGTKRVFFCGSFTSSKFVQRIITREMVLRNLLSASLGKPSVKFDFVRPSAYLGAMGVFIIQHEEEELALKKSGDDCTKNIHNGTQEH